MYCSLDQQTLVSLGLVSPGAATDGVTLFFHEKKLTIFNFSRMSPLYGVNRGSPPPPQ